MSIAILYEQAETDELGIKLTAKELGVDLVQIPFRKLLVSIGNMGIDIRNRNKTYHDLIESVDVVLNRAQSKNRRLYAARILETLDKKVLNPFSVEHTCFSKLWTLLKFWKSGVPIPKTMYVPLNSHEPRKDGGVVHNEEEIACLMQQTLGDKEIVIKPEVVDPDDVEMLQDLVLAAVNEALRKADEMVNSEMGKLTGGMGMPGLF